MQQLALKVEGGHEPTNVGDLWKLKKLTKWIHLQALQKQCSYQHLEVILVIPMVDSQPLELQNNKFMLFSDTKRVICYSSNRKLTCHAFLTNCEPVHQMGPSWDLNFKESNARIENT